MAVIRVKLFGGVRIAREGSNTWVYLPRAESKLLNFLMVSTQDVLCREEVIDILWPNKDLKAGRHCLNTSIWRLRKAFAPDGASCPEQLIEGGRDKIGIRRAEFIWVDLRDFRKLFHDVFLTGEGTLSKMNAELAERAVLLYEGDILQGVYDDWAILERERHRSELLQFLDFLVTYHESSGNNARLFHFAGLLQSLDPLNQRAYAVPADQALKAGHPMRAVSEVTRFCSKVMSELESSEGSVCLSDIDDLRAELLDFIRSRKACTQTAKVKIANLQVQRTLRALESAKDELKRFSDILDDMAF